MVARSVSSLLKDKVTLQLESIDRLYLNAYVPKLQRPIGFVYYLKDVLGLSVFSTTSIAPKTRSFVAAIESFAREHGLDLFEFPRGQRKDDIAHEYLSRFKSEEGVLFIGKAQEKSLVFRTEKRRDKETGWTYPWVVRGSALPNHYYFYLLDRDFGPLFIKFSSYFPFTAKVCLNGHESLKRQLAQRHIPFEALDNGILSCADPKALQRIAHQLDASKIDALVRKWFARLPHPFDSKDRKAG